MRWIRLGWLCLLLCSCGAPAAVTSGSPSTAPSEAASDAPSVVAATSSLAASATEQASPDVIATEQISATEVIRYVAAGSAAPSGQASCWTSSIAISRADAYRCMQENQIFDPCFAAADGASVVCQPNPAINDPGVSLSLAEPLPALTVTPARPSDAWLVQLEDGTVCSPFTGSRAEVNGKLTTYGCATPDESVAVLLGDLMVGTVWSAEKGIITVEQGGPRLKQSEQLAVARVWQ